MKVIDCGRSGGTIEMGWLSMSCRSFLSLRMGWLAAAILCWTTEAPAADLTVKAVIERLVQSTRERPADFSGLDLSFLDFSDLDFKGAHLAAADLYGTDLSHADLSGAIYPAPDSTHRDHRNEFHRRELCRAPACFVRPLFPARDQARRRCNLPAPIFQARACSAASAMATGAAPIWRPRSWASIAQRRTC
jgi:hypothetical protein